MTTTFGPLEEAREMMNDMLSFSNIYRRYLRCRRKKRNTVNALRFEMHLEDGICELEDGLKTETYQPARSVCFAAKKPKLREIFAADFKDRIVHHIQVDYLEEIFEPKFIFDSWACRRKKGNLAAVKRLQKFTRSVTSNNTRKAFYLQMDIKSFFANVYLNELDQFIKHDLKVRYYLRYADDFILLSWDKEQLLLWRAAIEKFLSERLGLELNTKIEKLRLISCGIDFLGYIIRPDYLLVRRRVVNNCRQKLKAIEEKLDREPIEPPPTSPAYTGRASSAPTNRVLEFPPDLVRETKESFSSYAAHFAAANSFHLVKKLKREFGFVDDFLKYFTLVQPHFFSSRKNQYEFFKKTLNRHCETQAKACGYLEAEACGYLIFFQSGCFYEFYGDEAKVASGLFGLKLKYKKGTGAIYNKYRGQETPPTISGLESPSYNKIPLFVRNDTESPSYNTIGFPVGLEQRYADLALKKGYSVYVFNQFEDFSFNSRQTPRVLTRKYEN